MRANIEMDVILETAEEKREGVWTPVGRDILEVRHIHKPTRQPSLDLFSKPAVENDGEDQQ
jgi:hypothetical protein